MTESTKIDYVSIVQDLRDEADLCRNETATDIADLLDDAASCIVAMKSQFTALRSELAAAQEAHAEQLRAAHARELVYANSLAEMRERAQRAEALAESNARDAQRYRWLREGTGLAEPTVFSCTERGYAAQPLILDELDAAIDAAIAEGKK